MFPKVSQGLVRAIIGLVREASRIARMRIARASGSDCKINNRLGHKNYLKTHRLPAVQHICLSSNLRSNGRGCDSLGSGKDRCSSGE